DQQLVQRLFAFVVTTAKTGATMAADGVDLIDEDDARRVFLALLKQVAHTRRAHTDKHLHEIRTGNREEGNVCFAGNRTGQQRFAGSRRSHHQNALRNTAAELLKLLRLLKKFDDLLKLFLRLFNTGNVLKRHSLLLIVEQLGPGLPKR